MDLLRNALETVCGRLDAHLQHIDRRADDWVVLTSLVDHDGSRSEAARDKIVMSVYGLSQETYLSQQAPVTPGADRMSGAPLYLDVHLMLLANFSSTAYADGLTALSHVIAFFHQTPVFTPQNAPGLAAQIDRITLDFETLSPADVSGVMSMMGAPYLPSAFYKLRMLRYGPADAGS